MRGMAFATLRMALLAVVAVAALIAVVAPVALGIVALAALRLSLRSWLQALERLGIGHEVRRERRDRDLLARRALDVAQIAALVGAAESDGNAIGAGARGAADAVDILLRHVGQ